MKYCKKCGNELLDEAVMCPKCGCVTDAEPLTKQQREQSKNQAKGAIFILLGIAVIVITVLLVISQLHS